MDTFPEKPTTQDLSDIPVLKRFPSMQSSMGGGNMVTEKLDDGIFAGQGSDSEATHDVVAADVDWVGNIQHAPDLPGPMAVGDGDLKTDEKGSGYTPKPLSWKGLH